MPMISGIWIPHYAIMIYQLTAIVPSTTTMSFPSIHPYGICHAKQEPPFVLRRSTDMHTGSSDRGTRSRSLWYACKAEDRREALRALGDDGK